MAPDGRVWDTYPVTRAAVSSAFAIVFLAAAVAPATAVRPTDSAAPPAKPGAQIRTFREVAWDRVPPRRQDAWNRFLAQAGEPGWRAIWDRATKAPVRIFGPGIDAPGTVHSASAAANFAEAFLARHIDLLAPGARPEDFTLETNHLGDGVRTVGYVQHHRGMRVIGGQVSFRFKADRLIVIASAALPNVRALKVRSAPRGCRRAAKKWIEDGRFQVMRASDASVPMVLPIVTHAGVVGYRTVVGVEVQTGRPVGQWMVYLDAQSSEPVARFQTLRYGTAAIYYDAPVRHPGGPRTDYPAANATVRLGGDELTTGQDGVLTWPGDGSIDISLSTSGTRVAVDNASGDPAALMTMVIDNGSAVWSDPTTAAIDAQLAAFTHVQVGKRYARTFAPDLEWLDSQLLANVNLDQSCNAYFDGETINFFSASEDCQNTGRIADVIYHELGHAIHANALLDGVGVFDGALSEGLSDYFAATITGDPGMGRGFFYNDEPLRNIDPDDIEHAWPDDIGEIHSTGLIISGALWDLRKLLIAKYGEEEGVRRTDALLYAIMQRAADIPTSYVEVLVANDDDGNLENGTPDVCEIDRAFGDHGLRDLGTKLVAAAVATPTPGGFPVMLTVSGLREECPGDTIASATLHWYPRDDPASGGTVAMVPSGDAYMAILPSVPEGTTLRYRIELALESGGNYRLPENPADPSYEMFVGEVVPLYCTDFEENPFAADWTHGLSGGATTMGGDDWKWGVPVAGAASGDPGVARSGQNVIGNDLRVGDMDGFYQPDKVNFAQGPVIDVERYSDVRLHYWRWLNVEDGYYDHATIYANGEQAWQNANSMNGETSSVHHRDQEWRFHDVSLSPHIYDGTVQVKFEIASDAGLELGGWTIDDFCVVAVASSICGDGEVTGAEECDDGSSNSNSNADACRKNCRIATCGDGIVDSNESCDDGNLIDTDDCTVQCVSPNTDTGGCGCDVPGHHSGGGAGVLVAGLALLGFAIHRRRRRA